MSTPHLPPHVPLPATPRGVVPLGRELGTVVGHRVMLLSLELWEGWADLRFARIDLGGGRRLTRRVPPAGAWRVRADGRDLEVLDAVGRGDRTFSNGEVRILPAPLLPARLEVAVALAPDAPELTAVVTVPLP